VIPADRVVKGFASDEAHHIEGPAVVRFADRMERHDAGMLEARGDFGFDLEPREAQGIANELRMDELDRDVAIERAVFSGVDGAQAALGEEAEILEAGKGVEFVRRRDVGVEWCRRRGGVVAGDVGREVAGVVVRILFLEGGDFPAELVDELGDVGAEGFHREILASGGSFLPFLEELADDGIVRGVDRP
jgi:hypothetical protein